MNTTKAQTRVGAAAGVRPGAVTIRLVLLLIAGLLIRLVFIPNQGFKTDVQSFVAWSLNLATHSLPQFYATTSFADYPPGYFYVLWVVGHMYALIVPHGGDYGVLAVLVKLPAIFADLGVGILLYAIVRRFADDRWALGAAALFILNPAIIFISAAWGQVDSIAGGLALLAVYLLLRCHPELDEGRHFSWPVVFAWLALGYSLLIKPQAAVLVPLFIAFAFAGKERRAQRLIATGAGIVASILLAYVVALPFHPTANPGTLFAWLYHQYNVGKNVYAFNSVNAFNLWSIKDAFWQPDSNVIFGLPQYVWGIALVVAAAALIVVRYVQTSSARSLVQAAALLTLAFFMLATRMHERYVYDGLLFAIAAVPFATRYLWSSVVLSGTLLVNLFYSLTYLTVVTQQTPGVNAADMWWPLPHLLSIVNVAVFFYLGYVYLGQSPETEAELEAAAASKPVTAVAGQAAAPASRSWFDPREGLAAMVWPLDYVAAGFFGVVAFFVSYVNYWLPTQKIFDEIYFARAAEEYLTHKYIYENTHPPLTKLIITLSTMLFGGMAHGDNSHGWRFLDVVFGAIVVVLIYAFAKRLTRSTLFASFAAVMLTADGMHFVQSRIATPEGIVVVFSLGALYAFYRYWIASQSTVRRYEDRTLTRAGISAAGAAIAGFGLSAIINFPFHQSAAAFIVTGVYLSFGAYLAVRLWIVPRFMPPEGTFATYAEGTRVLGSDDGFVLENPEGGTIDSRRKPRDLTVRDGELTISYRRDGSASYATPEGTATYTPGLLTDDAGESQQGRHANAWLIAFTLLLGALVASKWYGVMAYGVSFVVIAAVWAQRYWSEGRPKRWGNPYGFRLDVAIAAVVFLSMTIYVLVWVPDFFRQIEVKNVTDLVYRQYSMFEYHDTLKATHPYQSSWWQWPLDLRPIAYYWQDLRSGLDTGRPGACCVAEITSLPNPLILWFGLFCVPCVAYLAWREKNKGYALLIIAYLLQWIPWARSPRITFAYHFYVDIPIVILCNVIVLQRLWRWASFNKDAQLFTRIAVGVYLAAVVGAFIWFYPVLSGTPLPWNAWNDRMWLGSHWI